MFKGKRLLARQRRHHAVRHLFRRLPARRPEPGPVHGGRLRLRPGFRRELGNRRQGNAAMDGRLRYNMAAFTMDWVDFQLSRLDNFHFPGHADLQHRQRQEAAASRATWPSSSPRAGTFPWRFSVVDAELAEDYWVELAPNAGDGNPNAEKGRALPRVPKFKANISTRYSFQVQDYNAYVQAYWVHTGGSWNALVGNSQGAGDRDRKRQHSYDILNAAVGIRAGQLGRGTVRAQPHRRSGPRCSRTPPPGTAASRRTGREPSACAWRQKI